jgi:hypothetical protein
MGDPKALSPNAWKTVSAKCKIQDNDLHKALIQYDNLADDDHDEVLDCVAEIRQLALAAKKSKEAAANKEILKYLSDIVSAADTEQRDVGKEKADAEKENMTRKKAEAEAKKREGEEGEEDEEEEEEGEYEEKLLTALKKLKGAKEMTYQFVVCDGKPPAVMVAKRITGKHKDELAKVTGSKRFLHIGSCRFEEGHYVFDMEKPVSGLAKKLQESLKHHTGKKHPIRVGTEAAGADESPEGEGPGGVAKSPRDVAGAAPEPKEGMTAPFNITAPVGKGGKNLPDDVQAVQTALNKKIQAGLDVDGKSSAALIKAIMDFQKQMGMPRPDGRVDVGRGTARALANSGPLPPAPPPPEAMAAPKLGKAELAKAPDVWHGMRKVVDINIEQVKKAVQAHYAHEHPELVKEIDQKLVKLDAVIDKLDHRIADSLAKAHAAKDDAARTAELKAAKAILAEYIQFVKSEPLIAHIDSNPWVKVDLKKTVVDTITHMAKSIGT